MSTVYMTGIGQAHLLELGVPRAHGDMDAVIRSPGFDGGLVGTALVNDFLCIHPLAVLQIVGVGQFLAVPDGTLGHTATTLFGIVLSAVDKGTLAALAKGFGEIDIELGSNKRMNLFIESHSNIPLF